MNEWENYYRDWGNPTVEMMKELEELVCKFIDLLEKKQKEKEEKEKYPLFYLKEGIV